MCNAADYNMNNKLTELQIPKKEWPPELVDNLTEVVTGMKKNSKNIEDLLKQFQQEDNQNENL